MGIGGHDRNNPIELFGTVRPLLERQSFLDNLLTRLITLNQGQEIT
jgi:hypothetical protein